MKIAVLILLWVAAAAGQGQQQSLSCGAGTYLDPLKSECTCNNPPSSDAINNNMVLDSDDDPGVIRLAGIFDTGTYSWGHDVFEVTVKLINEGWWDVLPQGTKLEYDLENSNCNESDAMKAYWKLRTSTSKTVPIHGIVGARCSGASMALSRLAGLEGVPQLSPASNSASLSNANEFLYFSRMVAPNDERGEVGAMVAMLRAFGWERVGIIATDTQFAKDSVTAFKKAWVGQHHLNDDEENDSWFGQVAYSDTVRLTPNGLIDEESVMQVLDHIPTDPSINSRVILLAAHAEHAFPILDIVDRVGFQPDSVWVGPSSWAANAGYPAPMPGYIGLAPFRNRNQVYQDFMNELQEFQRAKGREEILPELPTFAAETVDAIRALTTAIASSDNKRDGGMVVQMLRRLAFGGVSGQVEFNNNGDPRHPLYSIFNAQPVTNEDGTKSVSWVDVGVTGTKVGSADLTNGIESLCFAQVGCGLAEPPDDVYPSNDKFPGWGIFLILFLTLVTMALVYVTLKYHSSRQKKRIIKAELESFRDSVVGLKCAGCKYIPQVDRSDIEQARHFTAQWMWKETNHMMAKHSADKIFGDPKDCWILYPVDVTTKIEEAFQKGQKSFSPSSNYVVDLKKFKQKNIATGYKRDVHRVMAAVADADSKSIDLSDVQIGDAMPTDLQKEPRMVLCEKDIIKMSSQRPDGWAFGTKLHHADEATARQLVTLALNGTKEDEGRVFLDSGWFQLDKTRDPTPDDLAIVQQTVGDSAALEPPAFWDTVSDANVVQKHELKNPCDRERMDVETAFLSTLNPKKVRVLKIERIQNLAMWQSYVVKRQTVCARETTTTSGGQGQDSSSDAAKKAVLDRFEKRWLFHGTNFKTMDKILQQGFNRSFCGKNATLYGKGVYFARDAKYSSSSLYAVPDRQGRQYIMACRVVVGEYCRGKTDALTPDIRDKKSQSLYDTTVDSTSDPSIYVTYHDAQAYPEYLITFQQT